MLNEVTCPENSGKSQPVPTSREFLSGKKLYKIFTLVLFSFFIVHVTFDVENCSAQSWTEQVSGVTSQLWSVSAINNYVAWACGDSGVVLRTTNSGINWTKVSGNIPNSKCMYNIFGWNEDIAIATETVYPQGIVTIYKTSNGGANWNIVYTLTSSKAFIDALWMTDINTAYAYGDTVNGKWHLLKSINGGNNWITWADIPASAVGWINGMFFFDANNVWFGTTGNYIMYSSNAGLSWVQQTTPTVNSYVIWFNSLLNGMAVGNSSLYKTTNVGINWINLTTLSGSGEANGICGVGSRWWVTRTSPSGIINYSSNNGSSWIQQYTAPFPSNYYNHLSKARNGTAIWGVRKNGGISNYIITLELLNPSNNSINCPININFSWKRLSNETAYNFILATDSLFINILVNDSTLTDTTKYITGLSNSTQYYWKVRGKFGLVWENFSDYWTFTTIIATPSGVPTLITPINNSINISLTPTLDWSDVATATKYDVMVSLDSLFNTYAVSDSSTVSQYTVPTNKLTYDKKYFWRARGKNIGGAGSWSTVWNFRTILKLPSLDTLIKNNKSITLNWSLNPADPNIIRYRIYRGLSSPATTLIDSVAGNIFTYTNTNLINGTTYYYRIKSLNNLEIESDFSNEKSASPFNKPPVANTLTNINNPNVGRVLTQNQVFNSSGSTDPDGTIDSVFWYVNNQLISSSHSLISLNYNFLQGLNTVKLIVQDNDGARDSSFATVSLSTFRKYFGGSNSSGLSMIGDSILFAIITQGNNTSVNKLDINGNTTLTLNVNGNVLSSSCIGYDTSIFIGSTDNNLYAFSRYGVSLWPALPLGGQLVASPTLDSSANRVYVGVSNNNFFCINKLTGQIIWSMFGNSPMRNSAVITNNKRLFVTSQSGTIYGVDLNNLIINGSVVTPNWTINSSDTITSSPAIDQYGYFYVGTKSGKLKKIQMNSGQPGTVVWETQLGGSINASPVIGANGNIYVGSTNGKFYAVKDSGTVKWQFTSSGQINTTAAISNYNRIYFGNANGDFYSIDTNAVLKWHYKDSSAIGNCVIASKGTIYYGTSAGVLAAFYDYIETENMNLTSVNVWPTYQSDNQRTGSRGYNTTIITNLSEIIPDKFELHQNYPNPFNPSTTIRFGIVKQANTKIMIYDVLGRQVATLVNASLKPGTYEVTWNASNYSSGIYYYIMKAESFRAVKRMVMIK
jgi:photosystem II stability/assembly factor-like uncharacterized protein